MTDIDNVDMSAFLANTEQQQDSVVVTGKVQKKNKYFKHKSKNQH